jgi:putative RNA 2'-phosphotransferase
MNAEQTKHISKFLSLVLRHEPERVGIKLDEAGWIAVDELLDAINGHGQPLTLEQLQEVVDTNDKKRFTIQDGYIRANQGHSIPVELQLPEAEPPDFLFHGTVPRFLELIREKGLLKGERHDVHLSPDRETAIKVGKRRGLPHILTVKARQMHRDGYKFYLSANGVWLTDHVPPQYIAGLP